MATAPVDDEQSRCQVTCNGPGNHKQVKPLPFKYGTLPGYTKEQDLAHLGIAKIVSYADPDSHSCGWITSPLRVW